MKDQIMLTLNEALSGIFKGAGPWVLALIIIIIGYFFAKLIAGLVRFPS